MEKPKNKIFLLCRVSRIFVYICFLGLLIWAVDKKINYHVDEFFSYGQANYQGGKWLRFTDGEKDTPSQSIFLKYLTADENHLFDYRNVWKNQITNVHPPLYHSLLHTVCSFFPGSFSKWYAASINIFFLLITLYFVGRITELISVGDQIIKFLVSLIFISSIGIISSGTYLRMYCMAMCWNTMMYWLLLKELANKKAGLSFYSALFCIAVLGALTHYYCIVFTVLSCAIYSVILLFQKRYKMILQLLLTGIVSALAVYAIWPHYIRHILYSYRGIEAAENLRESFEAYLPKLARYWAILIRDLFGGRSEFLFISLGFTVFIFLCSRLFAAKNHDKHSFLLNEQVTLKLESFLLLWLPVIGYFLLISKIAPYKEDRYIFPVYALILIGTSCFFFNGLKKFSVRNSYPFLCCLYLLILIFFEWKDPNFRYQYLDSINVLENAEKYHNSDCIFVYAKDYPFHAYPSFMEVSKFNSVTFIGDDHLDLIDDIEFDNAPNVIVYVDDHSSKLLEKLINHFPNLNGYKKLGQFFYATSYVFYLDEK